MTVSAPTANPFQIPHCDGTKSPLCPWRWPEHDEWYVDIDGFPEAVRRFKEALVNSAGRDDGQFFVVHGETGTGKTSLIHRCVDEASKQRNATLQEPERRKYIVDLSRYEMRSESTETTARLNEVAREVFRLLKKEKIADSGESWKASPEDSIPGFDYRYFYQKVADDLLASTGRTLIVILPPLDDWKQDIKEYRYLSEVLPRLIFFGETSYESAAAFAKERIPEAHYFSVSLLTGADRKEFFRKRMELCDQKSIDVAKIGKRDFNDFNETLEMKLKTVTVRMLLRFLFNGWADIPAGSRVRYADLINRNADIKIGNGSEGGGQP